MRIQPRQVPNRVPADSYSVEPLTVSRGEASCDFVIPSASVPAVRMGFGDLYAEQRRRPIVDGYGFTVELPAVIDLLASVEAGAVTAGCHVVRCETPEFYARPTGNSYLDTLRDYSHSIDRHSDRWDFEAAQRQPHIQALDPQETQTWIAEHIGPRGGLYYKPCRRCSPAL